MDQVKTPQQLFAEEYKAALRQYMRNRQSLRVIDVRRIHEEILSLVRFSIYTKTGQMVDVRMSAARVEGLEDALRRSFIRNMVDPAVASELNAAQMRALPAGSATAYKTLLLDLRKKMKDTGSQEFKNSLYKALKVDHLEDLHPLKDRSNTAKKPSAGVKTIDRTPYEIKKHRWDQESARRTIRRDVHANIAESLRVREARLQAAGQDTGSIAHQIARFEDVANNETAELHRIQDSIREAQLRDIEQQLYLHDQKHFERMIGSEHEREPLEVKGIDAESQHQHIQEVRHLYASDDFSRAGKDGSRAPLSHHNVILHDIEAELIERGVAHEFDLLKADFETIKEKSSPGLARAAIMDRYDEAQSFLGRIQQDASHLNQAMDLIDDAVKSKVSIAEVLEDNADLTIVKYILDNFKGEKLTTRSSLSLMAEFFDSKDHMSLPIYFRGDEWSKFTYKDGKKVYNARMSMNTFRDMLYQRRSDMMSRSSKNPIIAAHRAYVDLFHEMKGSLSAAEKQASQEYVGYITIDGRQESAERKEASGLMSPEERDALYDHTHRELRHVDQMEESEGIKQTKLLDHEGREFDQTLRARGSTIHMDELIFGGLQEIDKTAMQDYANAVKTSIYAHRNRLGDTGENFSTFVLADLKMRHPEMFSGTSHESFRELMKLWGLHAGNIDDAPHLIDKLHEDGKLTTFYKNKAEAMTNAPLWREFAYNQRPIALRGAKGRHFVESVEGPYAKVRSEYAKYDQAAFSFNFDSVDDILEALDKLKEQEALHEGFTPSERGVSPKKAAVEVVYDMKWSDAKDFGLDEDGLAEWHLETEGKIREAARKMGAPIEGTQQRVVSVSNLMEPFHKFMSKLDGEADYGTRGLHPRVPGFVKDVIDLNAHWMKDGNMNELASIAYSALQDTMMDMQGQTLDLTNQGLMEFWKNDLKLGEEEIAARMERFKNAGLRDRLEERVRKGVVSNLFKQYNEMNNRIQEEMRAKWIIDLQKKLEERNQPAEAADVYKTIRNMPTEARELPWVRQASRMNQQDIDTILRDRNAYGDTRSLNDLIGYVMRDREAAVEDAAEEAMEHASYSMDDWFDTRRRRVNVDDYLRENEAVVLERLKDFRPTDVNQIKQFHNVMQVLGRPLEGKLSVEGALREATFTIGDRGEVMAYVPSLRRTIPVVNSGVGRVSTVHVESEKPRQLFGSVVQDLHKSEGGVRVNFPGSYDDVRRNVQADPFDTLEALQRFYRGKSNGTYFDLETTGLSGKGLPAHLIQPIEGYFMRTGWNEDANDYHRVEGTNRPGVLRKVKGRPQVVEESMHVIVKPEPHVLDYLAHLVQPEGDDFTVFHEGGKAISAVDTIHMEKDAREKMIRKIMSLPDAVEQMRHLDKKESELWMLQNVAKYGVDAEADASIFKQYVGDVKPEDTQAYLRRLKQDATKGAIRLSSGYEFSPQQRIMTQAEFALESMKFIGKDTVIGQNVTEADLQKISGIIQNSYHQEVGVDFNDGPKLREYIESKLQARRSQLPVGHEERTDIADFITNRLRRPKFGEDGLVVTDEHGFIEREPIRDPKLIQKAYFDAAPYYDDHAKQVAALQKRGQIKPRVIEQQFVLSMAHPEATHRNAETGLALAGIDRPARLHTAPVDVVTNLEATKTFVNKIKPTLDNYTPTRIKNGDLIEHHLQVDPSIPTGGYKVLRIGEDENGAFMNIQAFDHEVVTPGRKKPVKHRGEVYSVRANSPQDLNAIMQSNFELRGSRGNTDAKKALIEEYADDHARRMIMRANDSAFNFDIYKAQADQLAKNPELDYTGIKDMVNLAKGSPEAVEKYAASGAFPTLNRVAQDSIGYFESEGFKESLDRPATVARRQAMARAGDYFESPVGKARYGFMNEVRRLNTTGLMPDDAAKQMLTAMNRSIIEEGTKRGLTRTTPGQVAAGILDQTFGEFKNDQMVLDVSSDSKLRRSLFGYAQKLQSTVGGDGTETAQRREALNKIIYPWLAKEKLIPGFSEGEEPTMAQVVSHLRNREVVGPDQTAEAGQLQQLRSFDHLAYNDPAFANHIETTGRTMLAPYQAKITPFQQMRLAEYDYVVGDLKKAGVYHPGLTIDVDRGLEGLSSINFGNFDGIDLVRSDTLDKIAKHFTRNTDYDQELRNQIYGTLFRRATNGADNRMDASLYNGNVDPERASAAKALGWIEEADDGSYRMSTNYAKMYVGYGGKTAHKRFEELSVPDMDRLIKEQHPDADGKSFVQGLLNQYQAAGGNPNAEKIPAYERRIYNPSEKQLADAGVGSDWLEEEIAARKAAGTERRKDAIIERHSLDRAERPLSGAEKGMKKFRQQASEFYEGGTAKMKEWGVGKAALWVGGIGIAAYALKQFASSGGPMKFEQRPQGHGVEGIDGSENDDTKQTPMQAPQVSTSNKVYVAPEKGVRIKAKGVDRGGVNQESFNQELQKQLGDVSLKVSDERASLDRRWLEKQFGSYINRGYAGENG